MVGNIQSALGCCWYFTFCRKNVAAAADWYSQQQNDEDYFIMRQKRIAYVKGLYYWISIAIKMQLLQIFNNCKYSIESYAIALLHYCNRIWEKCAIMEMQ